MDAPYQTTTRYPQSLVFAGFNLDRIGRWIGERRRIARTVRELETYSDRELADMGLSRTDIPAVARGELRR